MNLTQSQLAKYMDHTLLRADATLDGIDRVVAEAKQFGCASVCVNPFWVPYVARLLDGSGVATCTCLLYTSPSPRDRQKSRMPSSA